MAENKTEEKKLTLEDLGLDESSNPTPADIAEKENNVKIVDSPKINRDQPQITSMTIDTPVTDGPFKDEEDPNKKKRVIVKPNKEKLVNNSGDKKFAPIADVNKFLGVTPKPKVNPIRKTLDGLYEQVDEGIERTKKELSKPGGIIEEGKRKYIEYMYPKLMKRAESNKKLKTRIDRLHTIMAEDPRFDNATELEKKGYTLFVIAKNKDIGIDNEYFGIEEVKPEDAPRFNFDANKNFNDIIKLAQADDDEDFLKEFDDVAYLGSNKGQPSLLYNEPEQETTESENSKPDISKGKVEEVKNDEDVSLLNTTESEEDFLAEESEDEEELMSEEQLKEIQREYKQELITKLRLNRTDDLEGFSVESKPIELKSALRPKKVIRSTYTWPLIHTGIAIEMTPFENDEITVFNPSNTDFNSVSGLNTAFSLLYKHIVNPNKPDFETWLRQISDYDIDGLIFAGHAATFKDTNYITYECPDKKKCNKVFLEKKDIMDMVVFPNDETKKRFDEILKQSTVMKQTYTTSPKRISEDYAIGFTSQSIYSNLFEPASLSETFAKKYAAVIAIMPHIDKIYKIDSINKRLLPIRFGVVENSLSKTVERKVRAINAIFKTFTSDERAIVVAEAQKVTNKMDDWRLSYYIPETTCRYCGTKIERRESNPLNILFTRAQLPTVPAYILE